MITLDTNYIVRFFVKDVETQYKETETIICDIKHNKYISSIVLAESIFILENHYKIKKSDCVEKKWH